MKLNKIIITTDFLCITFSLALFILIFLEMKCVSIIYDRILNNLFIKDFKPVQKISLNRNICQEKDMYPLLNYTFPGISESCYDKTANKVTKGKCKKENITLITIPKIKRQKLSVWRNKIMCTKLFGYDKKSYNFVNETCEKGYKQCGHINKDSYNIHKILCIKDDLECPLNFLKITDNISSYNNSSEYNIFPFDNGYYLVTSNKKISNGIITKIKIAEGIYPCYESGEYSNTTSQFPTTNYLDKFNCSSFKIDETNDNKREFRSLIEENEESPLISEGYDIRYKKFDSIQKVNVLIDNDLYSQYSSLPNVSDWSQDIYTSYFNLFYLNSFVVKDECKKFNDSEKMIINLKIIQALRETGVLFHFLFYVIIVSSIVLTFIIKERINIISYSIKLIVSMIMLILNIILIVASRWYINNLKDFGNNLIYCLDDVSKAILNNHDINLIIKDLNSFFSFEFKLWIIYFILLFIQISTRIHLVCPIKLYLKNKRTTPKESKLELETIFEEKKEE